MSIGSPQFRGTFWNRIPSWAVILSIGLLSLLVNTLYLKMLGNPVVPRIHDEFSYLLGGETLSKGRLSNPPHPLWEHFESMHIFQQPTYGSKYPPGQALMLAIGYRLGNPHYGILLEGALAAMTVYFLLTAWMSRGWALAGAVLALFHPLSLEWSSSFWGGHLSVIGGAVTLGALLRGYRTPSLKYGLLMGLGVSILALSRPFEGALYTTLCLLFALVALLREGLPKLRLFLARMLPGFAAVLLLTAGWHLYYNYRVTGSALKLPYLLYEQTYNCAPIFLWQKAPPSIEYRSDEFARFAAWTHREYERQRTWQGFWSTLRDKLVSNGFLWLGYGLLVPPLLFALWTWRPPVRQACLLITLFLLCELSVVWLHPHYLACLFGMVIALAVMGYQAMARLPHIGPALAAGTLLAAVGTGFFYQPDSIRKRFRSSNWAYQRQELVEKLSHTLKKHLLLVSYSPDHSFHNEWVYNGADIDGSRVIFARSLKDNRRLLEYYKDRKIWYLHVGKKSHQLTPLTPE